MNSTPAQKMGVIIPTKKEKSRYLPKTSVGLKGGMSLAMAGERGGRKDGSEMFPFDLPYKFRDDCRLVVTEWQRTSNNRSSGQQNDSKTKKG